MIPFQGTGTGVQAFELDDMPSDFVSIESVTIRIRAAFFGGLPSVIVKIVESDGTTELTTDTGNITPLFSPTFNTVEFSVVPNGATDKTSWDGALFRFDLANFDETTYGVQGYLEGIEVDISYVVAQEEIPSGGVVASGVATVFPYFGDGGAVSGGTADIQSSVINVEGSGGNVVGGTADEFLDLVPSGGALIGGSTTENVFTYFASGPIQLEEAVNFPYRATYYYNPDLDIPYVSTVGLVDGDGSTSSSIFAVSAPKYTYIDEGLPGDSSFIPLQGTGSGVQTFSIQNVPSFFARMESVSIGIKAQFLLFGSPQVSVKIVKANGTSELSGPTGDIVPLFTTGGFETHVIDVPVVNATPSEWNGALLRFDLSNFDASTYGTQLFLDTVQINAVFLLTLSEGRIQIGSQTELAVGVPYEGSGTIYISGEATLGFGSGVEVSGTGMEFSGEATVLVREFHDKKFLWNYRTRIVSDKSFFWNTGEQDVRTFRVVTRCRPSCDPEDECSRRTIITITARTLAEVCRRLTERRLNLPIDTLDMYSVPSETSVIANDLANGILDDCITLIPQDFCEVPECLAFCIDFDLESIQEMSVSGAFVQDFENYVPDDFESIVIAGFSPAYATLRIHIYVDGAEGGGSAGGEAYVESSQYSYIADGDIIVDGDISGNVISSDWNYVAGVCPEVQGGFISAGITPSVSEDFSIWNDEENVTVDDGLSAYSAVEPDKPITEALFMPINVLIPDGSAILGIAVALERWAIPDPPLSPFQTHIPLFDNEIILVSTDIESDNKAFPNFWPVFPVVPAIDSYVVYGSDSDTWGRTWTSDELNDENFGLSIRLESDSGSDVLIGHIDGVQFEVYYCQVESGRIELGGSAIQKSSAYSAQGLGGIEVAGQVEAPSSDYDYIPLGVGISLVGNYGWNFDNIDGDGEIVVAGSIIGEVVSSAWTFISDGLEVSSGGDISGSVISSAWTWVGEGDFTLGDAAFADVGYYFIPTGGISMGGGYLFSSDIDAEGGIIIDGTIDNPIVSDLIVPMSGGIVMDGAAELFYGDFGDLEIVSEVVAAIDDISIVFSNVSLARTSLPSDTVDACGCLDLPLVIDLKTNIANENKFSKFLTRNNLSFPLSFSMKYNSVNDAWQSNFYYTGINSDQTGTETWNICFDLSCSSVVGGTQLGKSFLKFRMYAIQRTKGIDFDSRIFVVFDPAEVCERDRNLIFSINVDSIFKVATIDPSSAVQNTVFYDNIGLFKGKFWTETPDVLFDVSEVGTPRPVRRIDLTPTLEF